MMYKIAINIYSYFFKSSRSLSKLPFILQFTLLGKKENKNRDKNEKLPERLPPEGSSPRAL